MAVKEDSDAVLSKAKELLLFLLFFYLLSFFICPPF